MELSKTVSRRGFLKGAGAATGAAVLAACGGKDIVKTLANTPTPMTVGGVEPTLIPILGDGTSPGPQWKVPKLWGKEMLVWGLQYDPHVAAYNRMSRNFQQLTALKEYTVEPQGWPIEDNILAAIITGIDVPDVVCIMGKQISSLVKEGAILPMTDVFAGFGNFDPSSWFSPVGIDSYTRNGQMYGIPVEGNCTSGVVNVLLDEVIKLGLEELWPPLNGKDGFASHEDLWELAKAMMIRDSSGNVTRWGLSGQGWYANQLLGIVLSLGGSYYDENTGRVTLATPEGEEAMYRLAYKPIFELGIETQLDKGGQENMNAGRTALAAGNVTGTPNAMFMVKPPLRVDTCLYPPAIPGTEPKYVGEGGWGFVQTTQGKNREAATEMMRYIATYTGQADYCLIYGGELDGKARGGIVSAVPEVNNNPDLFPPGTLLGDSMARGGLAQKYTTFYKVGDNNPSDLVAGLGQWTEAVRIGDVKPKEAMKQAEDQINEAFALG